MKLLNRPVSPSWPDNGNHSSARLLLYVLWVGLHCEPLRNAIRGFPRGRCNLQPSGSGTKYIALKMMATAATHTTTSAPPPRRARSGNQPDTGSSPDVTVLSRCQNLQDEEQMV